MLLPSSRVLTLLSLPFRSFHAGASARCLGSKVKVKTRPRAGTGHGGRFPQLVLRKAAENFPGGPRLLTVERYLTRTLPACGLSPRADALRPRSMALSGAVAKNFLRIALYGLPRTFQVQQSLRALARTFEVRSLFWTAAYAGSGLVPVGHRAGLVLSLWPTGPHLVSLWATGT